MRIPRLSALKSVPKVLLVAFALVAASAAATPALAAAAPAPAVHAAASTSSATGSGVIEVYRAPSGRTLTPAEQRAAVKPLAGAAECYPVFESAYEIELYCQVQAGVVQVQVVCSNGAVLFSSPLTAGNWYVTANCYPYYWLSWSVS